MFEHAKQKLSGLFNGEDGRGVSPVVGIVMMVGITVVLAAVIGAAVMDMGSGLGENAQDGVSWDVDNENSTVTVTADTMGTSDTIKIRGEGIPEGEGVEISGVGETATLNYEEDDNGNVADGSDLDTDSGTLTAVGITEGGTETTLETQEYNFSED